MLFQIKSWLNASVIFELECESLKICIEAAVKVDANLQYANLQYANLQGAKLQDAKLQYANLQYANLQYANLQDANLQYANLQGANLQYAKSLRLPTGELFSEYLTQTVPALLTAGGKSLAEVATAEHWECHGWDNCPMAAAFSVKSLDKIPILHRPRAAQFVQLFDAGQLKLEDILPKEAVIS